MPSGDATRHTNFMPLTPAFFNTDTAAAQADPAYRLSLARQGASSGEIGAADVSDEQKIAGERSQDAEQHRMNADQPGEEQAGTPAPPAAPGARLGGPITSGTSDPAIRPRPCARRTR